MLDSRAYIAYYYNYQNVPTTRGKKGEEGVRRNRHITLQHREGQGEDHVRTTRSHQSRLHKALHWRLGGRLPWGNSWGYHEPNRGF